MSRKNRNTEITFEDSLSENPLGRHGVVEVPLNNNPFAHLGIAVLSLATIFIAQIFYLSYVKSNFYSSRAEANATLREKTPAPRGLISDRNGVVFAENEPLFTAFLDAKEFLQKPDLSQKTFSAIEKVFGLSEDAVWGIVREGSENDFVYPIVLSSDISQEQVVLLEGLDLSTIYIKKDFKRIYNDGAIFSHVVGYIGRVGAKDIEGGTGLNGEDFIGKGGVELYYDNSLRGKKGTTEIRRDAKGNVLGEEVAGKPTAGNNLRLTIDKEFQEYFYWSLRGGLRALGRRVGIGLAIDPRNGEILALINLPSFDNNLLANSGKNEEKASVLNSPDKPLFSRAVSGLYNPGSTIKPLVAVAALKEGVISPKRELFSPGHLDIPNPYFPDEFTRYNDWRYQGRVDLSSAIARSSNVYFYAIGGGLPAGVDKEILAGGGYVSGLGINRLQKWWNLFLLGKQSEIDLPGEGGGLLPSPEWKKENIGGDWLLGDTYNVSIGQGDLLITPLQLLNYIGAIANGGIIRKPYVNKDLQPKIIANLLYLSPEINEVRNGMREAVTSPLGTSYMLHNAGFPIGAKTGTVQVKGGTQENAIFVGFAPFDEPEIAILVLVEDAIEGSLNTVPIANDVLNWYYWNRVRK